jgi:ubiquinone/menaquinone biosynthesis C-methylase UbiE
MTEKYDALIRLLTMPRHLVEKDYSRYFYYYFRWCYESRNNAEDYILRWKNLFESLNIKEKVVLDIGCGFGINSIIFAISGAREVICVEHNAEKIEIFKKLLMLFNLPLSIIFIIKGSAEKLSIKNGSVDIALFNDVLSHIGDFETSLREASRVVKQNGKIFIEDGNNSLNLCARWIQHRYRKMWEIGPVNPDVVRGTDKPVAYREVRKQIIKKFASNLKENIVNRIARKTAGLTEDEIGKIVDEFLKTKHLPAVTAPYKYRHPITGECLERPFSPFLLQRGLKKIGFNAKILLPAMFSNFSGIKGLIKRVIILIHNKFPFVTVPLFSSFRILGIKYLRS